MICVHMYLCTSTNARILTEEALIYGCMVTFSVLYILLYSPHTIRKINLRKERVFITGDITVLLCGQCQL